MRPPRSSVLSPGFSLGGREEWRGQGFSCCPRSACPKFAVMGMELRLWRETFPEVTYRENVKLKNFGGGCWPWARGAWISGEGVWCSSCDSVLGLAWSHHLPSRGSCHR